MKGGNSVAGAVGDGSQNKPGDWIPIGVLIDRRHVVVRRRSLPSLLAVLLVLGLILSGAPVRAASTEAGFSSAATGGSTS